jgi:cytochrome P450
MATTHETIDLSEHATLDDPAFWDRPLEHVHAVFAELRRTEPVYWQEPGRFWVVSRYDDQQYVRREAELFSTNSGFLLQDNFDPVGVAPQLPEWAREPLLSGRLSRAETRHLIARAKLSMGDPELEHMQILDPPRHGEVRKVLTQALSQRIIRSLDGVAERVTADALDRLVPGQSCDFVDGVASRVPANVMAEIMGIDDEAERQRFFRGSNGFMESFNLTPESDPADVARLTALSDDFVAFQHELLERRMADPGDDAVSRIVQARLDGARLTPNMAKMYTMSLIAGGSDTTKNLISYIAFATAEHPDQLSILKNRPDLVGNAVDEVLRFYPIAWGQTRTATRRTTIRGRTIEEGDLVLLPIASANRDEAVWENPHAFDVTRTFDVDHQAFGWGAHLCPGGNLARLEGRAVLAGMVGRFSGWEVSEIPVRFTSMHQNGFRSLFVRCTRQPSG